MMNLYTNGEALHKAIIAREAAQMLVAMAQEALTRSDAVVKMTQEAYTACQAAARDEEPPKEAA
jgi:hypothetical protein